MAQMFLKIQDIAGESLDHAHAGEIELDSVCMSAKNQAKASGGASGAGTSHGTIEKITVKKICDLATVNLIRYCLNCTVIPEATITCRKNDGEDQVEYLVITLSDVLISAVDWPAQERETPIINETVDLTFAFIKVEYKPQANTGALGGVVGMIDFAFDIEKGKEADG